MRILLIGILWIIFILTGTPHFFHGLPVAVKCITYHFLHANIFHLAINCISVWYLFSERRPLRSNIRDFIVGFFLATISYLAVSSEIIGISNIIYAVLGFRTPSFSHSWWRSKPAIIFFCISAAMLFFPQFAALTHITSFFGGVLLACLRRKINSVDYDYKRAGGK